MDEDMQKAEEKALSVENAEEKNARVKDSVYYLKRETAPQYSNRLAAPLLKRHAAWEIPETAAHHKCSCFSSPPRTTWPNECKK